MIIIKKQCFIFYQSPYSAKGTFTSLNTEAKTCKTCSKRLSWAFLLGNTELWVGLKLDFFMLILASSYQGLTVIMCSLVGYVKMANVRKASYFMTFCKIYIL